MAQTWAERQRRTQKLIRTIAGHLFEAPKVSGEQLHGLCRLTWLTRSFDDNSPSYIKSTKIPALGAVFRKSFASRMLNDVAEEIAVLTNHPEIGEMICSHTGFTNFYNAYRGSSLLWLKQHAKTVERLFRDGYSLQTDAAARLLADRVERLSGIPKQNHTAITMHPASLLTPVLFALDPRLRFPIMNGNEGVLRLLNHYKVHETSLSVQFDVLVSLYGKQGIADAADLDQAGRDLPDLIDLDGKPATKALLTTKLTVGSALPVKDEENYMALRRALLRPQRRIHNQMTNRLRSLWGDYTLLEGVDKAAMFDISVQNFDGQMRHLLVEVKSSTEVADLRMAVGQLYSYWHAVHGQTEPALAVVLPERPPASIESMLAWLGVGLLWFAGDCLCTADSWLGRLATVVSGR